MQNKFTVDWSYAIRKLRTKKVELIYLTFPSLRIVSLWRMNATRVTSEACEAIALTMGMAGNGVICPTHPYAPMEFSSSQFYAFNKHVNSPVHGLYWATIVGIFGTKYISWRSRLPWSYSPCCKTTTDGLMLERIWLMKHPLCGQS